MTKAPAHHWRTEKIITLKTARERAAQLNRDGRRVVTVNGSFDLLHAGHLDLLEEARLQGDVLFVGLNSDASVREGKGGSRPIIPESERAAMLAALACVDYVVPIDAPYAELPARLLDAVKPDVHVNGSEYGAPETWVEWPAMRAVGAVGHTVSRRPGLATTDIVSRIKRLP
ncbi:MAG: adenylyltransferase/cytidyltransferase family protein [Patescibacteria group bacterium]|nr:adenylyltransferase/cytidyltransferase family protein [Patescibacteria group bacterium]